MTDELIKRLRSAKIFGSTLYAEAADRIEELERKLQAAGAAPDAHELWAAAQLAPSEGIEDGVMRIEAILQQKEAASATPAQEPYGYAAEGRDGHITFFKQRPTGFDRPEWQGLMTVHALYAAPAPSAAPVVPE